MKLDIIGFDCRDYEGRECTGFALDEEKGVLHLYGEDGEVVETFNELRDVKFFSGRDRDCPPIQSPFKKRHSF